MNKLIKVSAFTLLLGLFAVNFATADQSVDPSLPNHKALAEKSNGTFCCTPLAENLCTAAPDC
jgi:hypothetical protein